MEPTRAAAADGNVALQHALVGRRDRLSAGLNAKRAATRRHAVHPGPVTGLIAQVLLIGAIAGAVALSGVSLNVAGWAVGIACGVITNLALAHGLSHYQADHMSPADWGTLPRATPAGRGPALGAASFRS